MELNRNVLKKCTLWALLPWEVVITLMSELMPIVFPPMHIVVVEGQSSSGLHFIEHGLVTVIQRQARGRARYSATSTHFCQGPIGTHLARISQPPTSAQNGAGEGASIACTARHGQPGPRGVHQGVALA